MECEDNEIFNLSVRYFEMFCFGGIVLILLVELSKFYKEGLVNFFEVREFGVVGFCVLLLFSIVFFRYRKCILISGCVKGSGVFRVGCVVGFFL